MKKDKWIPFVAVSDKILSIIPDMFDLSNLNGKWNWIRTNAWKLKYISIKIDMRDGHCIVCDRNGNKISLDELDSGYRLPKDSND